MDFAKKKDSRKQMILKENFALNHINDIALIKKKTQDYKIFITQI